MQVKADVVRNVSQPLVELSIQPGEISPWRSWFLSKSQAEQLVTELLNALREIK